MVSSKYFKDIIIDIISVIFSIDKKYVFFFKSPKNVYVSLGFILDREY